MTALASFERGREIPKLSHGTQRNCFVYELALEKIALTSDFAQLRDTPENTERGLYILDRLEDIDSSFKELYRLDDRVITEAIYQLEVAENQVLIEGNKGYLENLNRLEAAGYPYVSFLRESKQTGILSILKRVNEDLAKKTTESARANSLESIKKSQLASERRREPIFIDTSTRKERGLKTIRINDIPLELDEPAAFIMEKMLKGKKTKSFKEIVTHRRFSDLCNIQHNPSNITEALEILELALAQLAQKFGTNGLPPLTRLFEIKSDPKNTPGNSTLRRRENIRHLDDDLIIVAYEIGTRILTTVKENLATGGKLELDLDDLLPEEATTKRVVLASDVIGKIVVRELSASLIGSGAAPTYDPDSNQFTVEHDTLRPLLLESRLHVSRDGNGDLTVTPITQEIIDGLDRQILDAVLHGANEDHPLTAKEIAILLEMKIKSRDIAKKIADLASLFKGSLLSKPSPSGKNAYYISQPDIAQ